MKCKEKRKNSYQKEIRQLQDLIRHKGNNQHNERVQRAEQGEILLSRRKQTQDFQVDDYGPCPNCWTISVISSLVIEGKTSSLSFLEPPIFLLSFLTPLLQLLYFSRVPFLLLDMF
jgi:hypothetical protein